MLAGYRGFETAGKGVQVSPSRLRCFDRSVRSGAGVSSVMEDRKETSFDERMGTSVKATRWCLIAVLAFAGCKADGGSGSMLPTWLGGKPDPQPLGGNSSEVVAALQARKTGAEPSFAERLWSPVQNIGSGSGSGSADGSMESRDRLSLDVPSEANPDLYCRIAGFAETKGSWGQARELYGKALSMDPKHLESQLGLARILLRQGETQAAYQQYQKAAADHPSSPVVHNDLGLFFLAQGQVDPARQAFAHAIQLDPTSRRYRNNMAGILVSEGEYEAAVSVLLEATDPATAYLSVAILARKEGANDVAQHFETRARAEAATLPPNHLARQYFDQSRQGR